MKSIYIINWTVDNIKFKHDVKAFRLINRHLLKFVDESIDITPRISFEKSSKNLKAFSLNQRQHLISKKKNSDRKLFEFVFVKSNIFRRYNIIFNNIDITNIINIIDTTTEKNIYHHSFDLDLSTNFDLLTNFNLSTNIFNNIGQLQSSFNVNIQRSFQKTIDRVVDAYIRRNPLQQNQQNSLNSLDSQKV